MLSLFLFNQCVNSDSRSGVFEASNFWHVNDKPVLSNGNIGFVPYGDSIYTNGLYNGFKDDSHRARIPHYANIQFEPCTHRTKSANECSYALDIYNGVFRTKTQLSNDDVFTVEHIQYAHRYFDSVLVNQIRVKRNKNTSNGIVNKNQCAKMKNLFISS